MAIVVLVATDAVVPVFMYVMMLVGGGDCSADALWQSSYLW